jgi:shikimate kinase
LKRGNIYLIGFSGTGKSNSGRRAAELLGWDFFEMDDRIEEIEGRKIPQIFSQSGEDYFRRVESYVLNETAARSRLVVSTGGGVPVRPENRQTMQQNGIVLRLTATPETIHARLSGAAGPRGRALRPMLGDEAPLERVRALLAEREPAYATADADLDTEGKSHEEVAREIVEAWRNLKAKV